MADFETYRVRDVDEAIELALKLRSEKPYDLFRGQVRSEWKPYTSLMRLLLRDPGALEGAQAQIIRFSLWLGGTPGLAEIAETDDAALAVAQHYGIPTHFLDFTTDPAVAGFFAADTQAPEPGIESCIYCLNSSDLLSLWDTIRKVQGKAGIEVPELEVVRPDVSNLWRLQAQSGAFLYAPTNWDVHYPMDRILFPYTGYPSYPTKQDIYPERKSQLEILLDQFFSTERSRVARKQLKEEFAGRDPTRYAWIDVHPPEDGYLPEYVRDGRLDPHPSWEAAASWLNLVDEHHGEVWRRDIPLRIDFSRPATEIARLVANGARRAMDRDATLREHLIHWTLEPAPADAPFRPALSHGLDLLWDGLRRLPVANAEIAGALGNWVGLYSLGFDLAEDSRQQSLFDSLLGESIGVGFSAWDGSGSEGFASIASLREALRPDLKEVLADESKGRADDLEFLLQIVTSPRHLFDFPRFASLFVTQIAPSQVARSEPHLFAPARLSLFGLT